MVAKCCKVWKYNLENFANFVYCIFVLYAEIDTTLTQKWCKTIIIIQNLQTLRVYIFHTLQHFATKFCNFTNCIMFSSGIMPGSKISLECKLSVTRSFKEQSILIISNKIMTQQVLYSFTLSRRCYIAQILSPRQTIFHKTVPLLDHVGISRSHLGGYKPTRMSCSRRQNDALNTSVESLEASHTPDLCSERNKNIVVWQCLHTDRKKHADMVKWKLGVVFLLAGKMGFYALGLGFIGTINRKREWD